MHDMMDDSEVPVRADRVAGIAAWLKSSGVAGLSDGATAAASCETLAQVRSLAALPVVREAMKSDLAKVGEETALKGDDQALESDAASDVQVNGDGADGVRAQIQAAYRDMGAADSEASQPPNAADAALASHRCGGRADEADLEEARRSWERDADEIRAVVEDARGRGEMSRLQHASSDEACGGGFMPKSASQQVQRGSEAEAPASPQRRLTAESGSGGSEFDAMVRKRSLEMVALAPKRAALPTLETASLKGSAGSVEDPCLVQRQLDSQERPAMAWIHTPRHAEPKPGTSSPEITFGKMAGAEYDSRLAMGLAPQVNAAVPQTNSADLLEGSSHVASHGVPADVPALGGVVTTGAKRASDAQELALGESLRPSDMGAYNDAPTMGDGQPSSGVQGHTSAPPMQGALPASPMQGQELALAMRTSVDAPAAGPFTQGYAPSSPLRTSLEEVGPFTQGLAPPSPFRASEDAAPMGESQRYAPPSALHASLEAAGFGPSPQIGRQHSPLRASLEAAGFGQVTRSGSQQTPLRLLEASASEPLTQEDKHDAERTSQDAAALEPLALWQPPAEPVRASLESPTFGATQRRSQQASLEPRFGLGARSASLEAPGLGLPPAQPNAIAPTHESQGSIRWSPKDIPSVSLGETAQGLGAQLRAAPPRTLWKAVPQDGTVRFPENLLVEALPHARELLSALHPRRTGVDGRQLCEWARQDGADAVLRLPLLALPCACYAPLLGPELARRDALLELAEGAALSVGFHEPVAPDVTARASADALCAAPAGSMVSFGPGGFGPSSPRDRMRSNWARLLGGACAVGASEVAGDLVSSLAAQAGALLAPATPPKLLLLGHWARAVAADGLALCNLFAQGIVSHALKAAAPSTDGYQPGLDFLHGRGACAAPAPALWRLALLTRCTAPDAHAYLILAFDLRAALLGGSLLAGLRSADLRAYGELYASTTPLDRTEPRTGAAPRRALQNALHDARLRALAERGRTVADALAAPSLARARAVLAPQPSLADALTRWCAHHNTQATPLYACHC